MNTTELLQAAYEAKPEFVEKTAMAVALLEAKAPEFLDELMQDLKEITDSTVTKVAAVSPGNFALAVGGAALGGLGMAVASDLYDAAKRGLTKGVNFRRIIEHNPELKQYNKEKLRSAFDTLHRYGPEFTADPNVGGQALRAMAEVPENQLAIVKDMIASRKNLTESRSRGFKGESALGKALLGE